MNTNTNIDVPAHGMDAARAGFKASANPHPHASREYYTWLELWHDAMRLAAARAGDSRAAAQYEKLAADYARKAAGVGAL